MRSGLRLVAARAERRARGVGGARRLGIAGRGRRHPDAARSRRGCPALRAPHRAADHRAPLVHRLAPAAVEAKLIANRLKPLPMLADEDGGTSPRSGSPRARATTFLLAAESRDGAVRPRVYIRPLPEMNGPGTSMRVQSGRLLSRAALLDRRLPEGVRPDRDHRSGRLARQLNALRRLGLRRLRRPSVTEARMVWNPQGFGNPDIPANSAPRVLPGRRVRRRRRQRPVRPGVQGGLGRERRPVRRPPKQAVRDRRVGALGHRRPRLRRAHGGLRARPRAASSSSSYFNGDAGSPWDLANKPRSRAAYRRLITPLGS